MPTPAAAIPGRLPLRYLLLAVVHLGIAGCDREATEHEPGRAVSAASPDQVREGNAVLHWSNLAEELMVDPGPIIDSRAFAILHAAIHDAVNGVERRYQPYTADLSFPGASLDAAVATAAHDVLIELSPSQREKIEAAYAAALAAIPNDSARSQGVTLGRESARANLERRAGDGVPVGPWPPMEGPITQPVYVPNGKPGDYAFTPPFDKPPLGPLALFPGWGRLPSFVVDIADHRVPGPQHLTTAEYAADFDSLKVLGRLHSTVRTADQAETAFFWFEDFPIWHQIANTVIRQNNLDPWRAARILALVHFAVIDGGIACFEAKYHFRFWRPYTAIRQAGEDGNPATQADAEWRPLLWPEPGANPPVFLIPPIPEYPSAAATVSGAAAEVLIQNLGDQQRFEATSPFLPGVTRRFTSLTVAAKEASMSRVYGGIHFLHAVRDGYQLGKGVGAEVSRMLAPVGK